MYWTQKIPSFGWEETGQTHWEADLHIIMRQECNAFTNSYLPRDVLSISNFWGGDAEGFCTEKQQILGASFITLVPIHSIEVFRRKTKHMLMDVIEKKKKKKSA